MHAEPDDGAPPDLWDPLVRISHWGIAIVVILNVLITRGGSALHVGIGWVGMALLLLRLSWGFVGPPEARFRTFPPNPMGALRHLGDLLAGQPRHFPSHNPAGAMMAYALWAALGVVVLTGLGLTTASPLKLAEQEAIVNSGDWSALAAEGEGADAKDNGNRKFLMGIHEVAVNLMLLLAVLHVAGVVVESRAMRRNLVGPMIAGRRGPRG
jgi:cytochrome b